MACAVATTPRRDASQRPDRPPRCPAPRPPIPSRAPARPAGRVTASGTLDARCTIAVYTHATVGEWVVRVVRSASERTQPWPKPPIARCRPSQPQPSRTSRRRRYEPSSPWRLRAASRGRSEPAWPGSPWTMRPGRPFAICVARRRRASASVNLSWRRLNARAVPRLRPTQSRRSRRFEPTSTSSRRSFVAPRWDRRRCRPARPGWRSGPSDADASSNLARIGPSTARWDSGQLISSSRTRSPSSSASRGPGSTRPPRPAGSLMCASAHPTACCGSCARCRGVAGARASHASQLTAS